MYNTINIHTHKNPTLYATKTMHWDRVSPLSHPDPLPAIVTKV